MANYVRVIQREVEVNQNPVFIGMEIIQTSIFNVIIFELKDKCNQCFYFFQWTAQQLSSSDDECTTRTGVPEKKAQVIIPHESPMKSNVSVIPGFILKTAIDPAMFLHSAKDIEINPEFKSKKLTKTSSALKNTAKLDFVHKIPIKQNSATKTNFNTASVSKTATKKFCM
jgi:hypothetical protein